MAVGPVLPSPLATHSLAKSGHCAQNPVTEGDERNRDSLRTAKAHDLCVSNLNRDPPTTVTMSFGSQCHHWIDI